MKRTISVILISCLIFGLLMTALDLTSRKNDFNIPPGYDRYVVDLDGRSWTDVLLISGVLEQPSYLELFFQSNAEGPKTVTVVGESEILGTNGRRMSYVIGTMTGSSSSSPSLLMDAGKYSIYLTCDEMEGKLAIGHRAAAVEMSEFERLSRIHKGDLNAPPEGYEQIYAADISGKACRDETIYTLSLGQAESIGLSIYTSARQGVVSVDLIGENMFYYGLINPEFNRICNRLEIDLPAGEYRLSLTCEDARGELAVFIKR